MIKYRMKVGSDLDKKLLAKYNSTLNYDSFLEFLLNNYNIIGEFEFPYFTLCFESEKDLTMFLLKV